MIIPNSDISFEEIESCCKSRNKKRKSNVKKYLL